LKLLFTDSSRVGFELRGDGRSGAARVAQPARRTTRFGFADGPACPSKGGALPHSMSISSILHHRCRHTAQTWYGAVVSAAFPSRRFFHAHRCARRCPGRRRWRRPAVSRRCSSSPHCEVAGAVADGAPVAAALTHERVLLTCAESSMSLGGQSARHRLLLGVMASEGGKTISV
jgi:hypothetical protein